jgi:ABC-type molybdenum transport system ATPase subunit/photorepair protein PhrA
MNVVLNFEQVCLSRGGRNILSDITWQVESNQRWVIVGPNGAGKTTLLRIASTHLQPSSGTVQVLGSTLGEVNVFDLRTRIGFASTAIANRIPNSENVLDAVMTASYAITGRFKETYDEVDIRRAKRVLGEWQLADLAARPFGTLSDRERKRTQIARAVMPDPELLLLDEPSMGLAPNMVKIIFEIIQKIHARGISILLVEQNAYMALSIAEKAYVLEGGHISMEDSGVNLLDNPEVMKSYLGEVAKVGKRNNRNLYS